MKNFEEDVQRMELILTELEMELREEYCDIGKFLLEAAESRGKKVNDLVDRIVDCRKCLAEMNSELECSQCGGQNSTGSNYCSRCGRALPSPTDREES